MQSTPKLNQQNLRSALIGMVLGDACIRYTTGSRNASISMTHSVEQKEYVEWKANIIREIPGISVKIDDKITIYKDKSYPQVRLSSTNSRFLNHIHHSLYDNGPKKISRYQLNRLTPLAIAIWYMDDGNLAFHYKQSKKGVKYIHGRELMLNTQSFSYEEHLIIQQYFQEVWNVSVKIHRNKNSFRITMNGTEALKFLDVIKDYALPSMEYKFDLRYNNAM
jgi:recombination protein RecA